MTLDENREKDNIIWVHTTFYWSVYITMKEISVFGVYIFTFFYDFPIEFFTVRTVVFSIFHFIKRILNMPKMYWDSSFQILTEGCR
jgi:hypothetical protein